MQELLEYIVKNLVSNPDQVKIDQEVSDNTVNLNLTVAPDDMGKVIGKAGQTIRSIRRLLVTVAMSTNSGTRVSLNLVEEAK
ncbi:KH domain-containing protein [Patescibacteria group bacterium]|nr:KH domain-containing protein [Patescibacteria group bacterium]MCL5409948.1 KH domain-containing protein [Patescibacteria group bacterium]